MRLPMFHFAARGLEVRVPASSGKTQGNDYGTGHGLLQSFNALQLLMPCGAVILSVARTIKLGPPAGTHAALFDSTSTATCELSFSA